MNTKQAQKTATLKPRTATLARLDVAKLQARTYLTRLFGLLLVALAVNAAPAFAACTNPQGTCLVGPGISCTQLLWDTQLSQYNPSTCEKWFGSGWTSYHGTAGGDYFWEIQPLGGWVYQQVAIPSDTDAMDVSAVINLVKNTPGTEKIVIELTNTSGTVLQSLGTYYASTSGNISFNAEATPLPGQTVRVRFRVVSGSAPGDTLFRVTYSYVRALNYP